LLRLDLQQQRSKKIGNWSAPPWRRGPSNGTTGTMVNPALVVDGMLQLHQLCVYIPCLTRCGTELCRKWTRVEIWENT